MPNLHVPNIVYLFEGKQEHGCIMPYYVGQNSFSLGVANNPLKNVCGGLKTIHVHSMDPLHFCIWAVILD